MTENTLPYWRQHYTARTYLASWHIEPLIKHHEECWTFRVTAQCQWDTGERKPVGEIMWEPDLYSLYGEDGTRNIHYEQTVFGSAERDYGQLKQLFGTPQKLLIPTNRKKLVRFAAFQVMKVPVMFSSYRWLLGKIIDGLDQRGMSQSESMVLEVVNKHGVKTQHSVDEARPYLKGNGFEHFSVPRLHTMHSLIKRMKLLLVTFSSADKLITSATPAIIWGPHYWTYLSPFNEENSRLVMPLSPDLLAVFNWKEEVVITGDARRAMHANILQVRNARNMLVGTSETIASDILNNALTVPEATASEGFRGHLDPVHPDVLKASPSFMEAFGPNIKSKLFEVWPDGRAIEVA